MHSLISTHLMRLCPRVQLFTVPLGIPLLTLTQLSPIRSYLGLAREGFVSLNAVSPNLPQAGSFSQIMQPIKTH